MMSTETREWSYWERNQVRLAGMLVPLLLFADDMVVIGRTGALVQRLLDTLSLFCGHAGLTVNLTKTVWLVGGHVPRGFEPGELLYRGHKLTQVGEFRYLGLMTNGHSLHRMVEARKVAATAAWGKLMGVLVQRGWRDRATRLLLFDTYVKTGLLYGCALWGMHVMPAPVSLTRDCTERLGTFYRGSLRALLGVSRVRNEIVYVLSGRVPL